MRAQCRCGMWERTLVAFVSDNGAQLDHGANFPFRGGKHTFWEGGVRVDCGGVPVILMPPTAPDTAHSEGGRSDQSIPQQKVRYVRPV